MVVAERNGHFGAKHGVFVTKPVKTSENYVFCCILTCFGQTDALTPPDGLFLAHSLDFGAFHPPTPPYLLLEPWKEAKRPKIHPNDSKRRKW